VPLTGPLIISCAVEGFATGSGGVALHVGRTKSTPDRSHGRPAGWLLSTAAGSSSVGPDQRDRDRNRQDRATATRGSCPICPRPAPEDHAQVIASISNFTDVGDITTLANPEIVEDVRHHVQGEKLSHGDVPRQLTAEEEAEIKAFGHAE
jgi:hypothetical protein